MLETRRLGKVVNLLKHSMVVFPLAALFNSFSMTVLLLVFGLSGRTEIAADIGLVQGATLALFYAFSANARNLILASGGLDGGGTTTRLIEARLILLLPLALTVYFLTVSIAGVLAPLAVVLICRRASEWMGEIGLARHELQGQRQIALETLLFECLSLSLCILLPLFFDADLAICAIPWAFSPLLAIRKSNIFRREKVVAVGLGSLLPHFGSTAIIGASVYVFRISIALLTGKSSAGMLFTAFAIGGLIPTVFGQALAPTLVHRYGAYQFSKRLLLIPAVMLIVGVIIIAIALFQPDWFKFAGRPILFWLATGLSVAGGAVMTIASVLRTQLIHLNDGRDVFGPDLLANVLISTCVPFVFYIFGPNSLAGLYLLSACLSLAFLLGAGEKRSIAGKFPLPILCGIGVFLVLPVFFQMSEGLFRDPSFVFETRGVISLLPIPVSILGLFGGVAILGNFAAATRTMTVLFFMALLFVVTSLIAVQGNSINEGAKLILLAQFLLPIFGLVLGEMYGAKTREPIFELTALWVLLLILPLQLIATWIHGHTLLVPKVFFFSIYQHLQYFPMIVVALAIIVSLALWNHTRTTRMAVAILLPTTAIYLVSSMSIGAIIGFVFGLASLAHIRVRSLDSKLRLAPIFAVTLFSGVVYFALAESGFLSRWLNQTETPLVEMSWQAKFSAMPEADSLSEGEHVNVPTGLHSRSEYWRFYLNGIVESPRTFLIGHATPPDRNLYPSAHNYWLDLFYNFGLLALLPLLLLIGTTAQLLWQRRAKLFSDPVLLGAAMASTYLLFGENMLKVGMRQPYPGIVTFFIWGLLLARLGASGSELKTSVVNS